MDTATVLKLHKQRPGWDLCSLCSCWRDEKRPVSSVMSHSCGLYLSAGKQ